jgi:hypothetical protein
MALSRFHWLFVVARNSSFTYKGRAVDVKQVGPELGVRYVLARISHRTNARLGGYSDYRVCGVVGMLAGGAGRREECWNHFVLPAQRRSGLGGPWDDAARATRCGGACQAGEPRALAAARRRAA